MLAAMEASARPGYELWRPNRAKSENKITRVLVAIVFLISAALILIIAIGGWDKLQSGTVAAIAVGWALMYILFAFLVLRWNRGVLPVGSAFAIILAIFAVVAAPAWFARDKEGLTSPALPDELLGLLTFLLVPVQLVLIAIAMVGFNQNWHVEEERRTDGRDEHDDSPPDTDERRPAAAPA